MMARKKLTPEDKKKRKQDKRIKKGIIRGVKKQRRKESIKKKKEQARSAVPSGFTLANAFLGFLALLTIFQEEFMRASVILLFANFMDMLDGKLARQMGLTSDFGIELDSLADTISFVVAPAMMIYFAFFKNSIGIVIGAVAVMCGIIRLAKFNIKPFTGHYIGISTPLFTYMVLALSLVKVLEPESVWATLPPAAHVVVFLLLSLTMISPLLFPAFRQKHLGKYKIRAYLVVFLFAVVLFARLLNPAQLTFLAYALIVLLILLPLQFEQLVKKMRLTLFTGGLLVSAAVIAGIVKDTTTLLLYLLFYLILGLPALTPCFSNE